MGWLEGDQEVGMETNHSEAPELLGVGAKKGEAQALPINYFAKNQLPLSICSLTLFFSPTEGNRPLKKKRSPKGFPVEGGLQEDPGAPWPGEALASCLSWSSHVTRGCPFILLLPHP